MSSNTFPLTRGPAVAWRLQSQRWFWIRAGVAIGQTLLLAFLHDSPDRAMSLPLLLAAACIAAAAGASLFGLLQVERQRSLDEAAFFRQILVDVALLTYMLAISGGPANPFHDAYFLPVAVAAATLPARLTWRVVATSLACYALVQFVYLPLPGDHAAVARVLRPGELITHVFLAVLAAYFLMRITHQLREQVRQLDEARDCAARAECAVTVGSIAAGAAHELGTPLTTITAVLDEMSEQHGDRPELKHSLDLLQASVAECRKALDVLRQSDCPVTSGRRATAVSELFNQILGRFRGMSPRQVVTTRIGSRHPEPAIVADLAFQQAVINLLSNAAAVSPHYVRLDVEWTPAELTVRVTDRGPGIEPEVASRIGRDFVSTKPGGCGVGLLLTQVTAQRLGGRFQIQNASRVGAVAEIVVPMASLQSTRR